MKRTGFDYRILATFTITGAELGRLITLSRLHYDGLCRMAGVQGGFLYGLCNQWAFHNADKNRSVFCHWESPASLDEAKSEMTQAELALSTEVSVSTRELDILAKIGEGEQFYCHGGDNAPKPMMLTMQFVGMLRECVDEFNRISPPVTLDRETVTRNIWPDCEGPGEDEEV